MVGTAPGIQAALADTAALDQAAYTCRHRFATSRRVCWWYPGTFKGWRWKRWRWKR